MKAEVVRMFIAPRAGELMQEIQEARIMPGGIAGDRYASGKGIYQLKSMLKVRDITFIAEEAIVGANEELVSMGYQPVTARDTRRNIVTRGIDLNALVGKFFCCDKKTVFQGIELAVPCKRPLKVLGWDVPTQRAFEKAFDGRGGLRAKVMAGGDMRAGQEFLEVAEEALMDFVTGGHPGVRRRAK